MKEKKEEDHVGSLFRKGKKEKEKEKKRKEKERKKREILSFLSLPSLLLDIHFISLESLTFSLHILSLNFFFSKFISLSSIFSLSFLRIDETGGLLLWLVWKSNP